MDDFEPTAMAQGAGAMHELFVSYVEAGFTEDQALKLIVLMVKTPGAT